MRTITLEEHATIPQVWDLVWPLAPHMRSLLEDMGDGRLADMDANGIDMQVLSLQMQPAWDEVDPEQGAKVVRAFNEAAAAAVEAHPDRFALFAALPLHDPAEAARELEHAVRDLGAKGALVGTRAATGFLSDEVNWPLWETAESLDVPVYMHPEMPPKAVYDTYYADLGPTLGPAMASGAWGWHADTGMHTIRLIVRGVFDRFPNLQVIIGHMGECTPFMMGRLEQVWGTMDTLVKGYEPPFQRPIREYFTSNIHITTSGFFDNESFQCALSVVGADRIMLSVDYPFSSNASARQFIDSAPIDDAVREAIAHGNVERLLNLPT
jgi:predicted TIM-barrel fold metal-dependent hydrolase